MGGTRAQTTRPANLAKSRHPRKGLLCDDKNHRFWLPLKGWVVESECLGDGASKRAGRDEQVGERTKASSDGTATASYAQQFSPQDGTNEPLKGALHF